MSHLTVAGGIAQAVRRADLEIEGGGTALLLQGARHDGANRSSDRSLSTLRVAVDDEGPLAEETANKPLLQGLLNDRFRKDVV